MSKRFAILKKLQNWKKPGLPLVNIQILFTRVIMVENPAPGLRYPYSPYSVQIRKKADQNNSEYEQILRSVLLVKKTSRERQN